MSSRLGVVIVTRNHGRTIGPVLKAVFAQSRLPDRVLVVDCGSEESEWIQAWRGQAGFEFVPLGRNAGFAGGNNEGLRRLHPDTDLVLFLNPDVIMPPDLLARLCRFADEPRAKCLAAWSVRLMGWDFERDVPTGRVDSTGIFPCWTGWKDRREDSPDVADVIEQVPALCGAFLMARLSALTRAALAGDRVWDERYLAYKEDVELSLRLRRAGGNLGIWHGAEAFHGRGWHADRRANSREVRLLSARNELRLHRDYMPWRVPLSLAKLALVRWLDW